jgi:hypothetical protein
MLLWCKLTSYLLFDAREKCEAMLWWKKIAKAKIQCSTELEGFGNGVGSLWVAKARKHGNLD